jgi:hypothetical protein
VHYELGEALEGPEVPQTGRSGANKHVLLNREGGRSPRLIDEDDAVENLGEVGRPEGTAGTRRRTAGRRDENQQTETATRRRIEIVGPQNR